MSQQELLKHVIKALEKNNIRYMITGSVASSLQGEPRSTHDIDIVIAVKKPEAEKLADNFPPPDFYLDKQSIIDAIDGQGMFNLIDVRSGDKVDFWMLTEEPFDRSRFSRRISEKITGFEIYVSAPEDTILAKLKWAKLSGGSEKQFTDALRIYEVQYEILNIDYLKMWAEKLDIEDLYRKLETEAETI